MRFTHRKVGTKTSSFGSPGRINHDSTPFYSSRLYEGLPKEEKGKYVENQIPAEFLDKIFCKTSEQMEKLPDNSVHLMVTSPPYNVGKTYDENLTLSEYRTFLKRVWREVRRVLVPGGRACINIANLGRKPYIPLHTFIVEDMLNLGFLMRGEIIWNKASSGSPSTAWGSWLSAKNPTLRDIHEYILVFSKGMFTRENLKNKSTISKEEFLEFTKSIWTFSAEPARKVGHPAPFPVELPYRLIQLYTFEGEVVLDPFIGSGQAAIAAVKTKRHYVGYEINEEYVKLATKRIGEFSSTFNAPHLFRFKEKKYDKTYQTSVSFNKGLTNSVGLGISEDKILVDIFEKAEKTLIAHNILNENSRNEAKIKEKNKIRHFKEASDDDFFFKMAMIIFYSGFNARIVSKKEVTIKKYFSKYNEVANYEEEVLKTIMSDEAMIKNKRKIKSLVKSAKKFESIVNQYGGFREYLYSFNKSFPLSTEKIKELKEDLTKRFDYFGPVTVNHFLTDFAFQVLKPDRMVMRVLHRTHLLKNESSKEYEKAIEIGKRISNLLEIPIRYVDTVFVSLGQVDRANICSKSSPKCSECDLEKICNFYS